MQFGNIKAFTVLCNHHQCLHSHLLILSPHFPENPCQALPIHVKHPHFFLLHLKTFSLPLSPLLPILWVSAINANHWNDRKIDFIFFLTEREIYRRLVLLESLQSNGSYSPWSYLGQKTGMGNFSILQGIFLTLHILQIQVENYLFYFIWSILSVKEGTV